MIKERYLTVRWNNVLAVMLGLPLLIYAAAAASTALWGEPLGFILLMIFGAVY
jgi:hypothetical protein